MRIVQLTNDNREIQKQYHLEEPVFGPAPEALLEGFKLLGSRVEVHIISCLQKVPVHSPNKLAENLFFHPLHVPNIGWLKTGYLGCIQAVKRKLSEIRPDIVHGQGAERECAICAVCSGYPNILTIHGHMSRIAELTHARLLSYYWLAARLERFCLRRTKGVICLTGYTERKAAPYTRNTWVVPNAVDQSFFEVPRSPARIPRILCAANVSPWKNQVGLIQALDPLQTLVPFDLIFAGTGTPTNPYFQQFSCMIAERSWCRYLGPLDRQALQQQISQATAGVLPSLEDNCPMVVLEAAAAGLPFAASRIGGIPDLIRHGETGLLFSPHHADEIRSAVMRLTAEPDTAAVLATMAREEAVKRFAPIAVAEKHLEVYREVLSSL